ncbi:sigma-70 family RNA polymerase sigma factor [Sneathiella sp. HT1-7]|jgi:RNA polymerase sigma-70 factor (ECF subfamily)|uniref:sigma-70 family RNA polymerase sigma factor n=1 Tax=Sneathiella sp. HT1-7 TaxID=2887192 RepID=UPI001D13F46D|nr:sigma-70 family RNA polymerase sigma factor [Sneathiella sp. HT1-7]MCC3304187.1 sigma-70 family RNA polymerase sigma factor [Sneathiella sp. HT1-7]
MHKSSEIEKDAKLMQEVANGNASASRMIADLYLDRSYHLALRILGDNSLAEDMAQEAFIKLWKQAPKWQAKAQIRTWLHRVTHNLCVDYLRAQKRYSDEEVPDMQDPRPDVLQIKAQQQLGDKVSEALQKLPARQRIAISLVHFEECGNIEAAAIMEVSVDALESLLARGRRKLKELLLPTRRLMDGEEI